MKDEATLEAEQKRKTRASYGSPGAFGADLRDDKLKGAGA